MHRFSAILACLLLLQAPLPRAADPLLPPPVRATADGLIAAARGDTLAMELVTSLTTEIGPRLAGTAQEARARDWAVDQLTELGFAKVRVEPFDVPLWVRGDERAEIVEPFPQPLTVTALGGSTSTGPAVWPAKSSPSRPWRRWRRRRTGRSRGVSSSSTSP